MTEQTTLLSRIGRWFKGANEDGAVPHENNDQPSTALETRTEGWIAGLQLAALST